MGLVVVWGPGCARDVIRALLLPLVGSVNLGSIDQPLPVFVMLILYRCSRAATTPASLRPCAL